MDRFGTAPRKSRVTYTLAHTAVFANWSDLEFAGWFAQSMRDSAGFQTCLTTTVPFTYISF